MFRYDLFQKENRTYTHRLISPALAEELGIVIYTHEVEDEDQFGRYTYNKYTVSYRGEKYWDVETKKR